MVKWKKLKSRRNNRNLLPQVLLLKYRDCQNVVLYAEPAGAGDVGVDDVLHDQEAHNDAASASRGAILGSSIGAKGEGIFSVAAVSCNDDAATDGRGNSLYACTVDVGECAGEVRTG